MSSITNAQLFSALFQLVLLTIVSQFLFISNADAHDDWGGSVVVLTPSNFDKKVMQSSEAWLINFYAPWCPHCKNLKPHFEEASRLIRKKGIKNVKLGAIDASEHKEYASMFSIRGFPTLKYFPGGTKSQNDVRDYDADRSPEAILKWAEKIDAEQKPPPEVKQMLNMNEMTDSCANSQLCYLAFLPKLYDCQSDCRKRYIKTLQSVSDKFVSKSWTYYWIEAGAQPGLEETLKIGGFGYPALVALNYDKKLYATMKGSFSLEGIAEFAKQLSLAGKVDGTARLTTDKIPKIETTKPWDGKDYVWPESDEL